ncbi:DNA-binding response regulator [Cohnella sp. 56]|uniref:DNA-binding response regulator n=1 Tax=Cohnella sp. 56 TaxID=3113722 RepID=UPI0030E88DBC
MMDKHYEQWLVQQRRGRTGESLRRLLEGHAHNEALFAKEVWLSAVGNFDYLHAEYEVPGFGEGSFFIDHAYLRSPHKIGWEIDDFTTHGQHVNRRTFEYERERQNQLVLNGWIIFRMPLDLIRERPRKCQQFVLHALGRLYGDFGAGQEIALPLKHREILRFANKLQRSFTPGEVCELLCIGEKQARSLLRELTEQGWIAPATGERRIRTYKLTKSNI